MKRLLVLIMTILVLSACGQKEDATQEMSNSTAGNQIEDSTEELLIDEDMNSEADGEAEVQQIKGFTPFEEISDFVIDDKTFESVYFEVSNAEDELTTWDIGNIRHILKAEDGTLYYFSDNDNKEAGLIYEVFTFDENNTAVVESKIYSPTSKKLKEDGEYYGVDKQIIDNMLVMRYEHHEDYDNATMQVTVETLDISGILAGEIGEYETEVVTNKHIGFIEDERYDFGDIVSTSKGPAFVYQENPENRNEFQMNPLSNNGVDEELVINDPHDIVYSSSYIKFIDFEQGNYFVYDSGDDGLKRLEIESGEPLYDGANDKVLQLDSNAFDYISPLNDHTFYAIDDYNYSIYIINTDLELMDSTSLFASEYEEDEYEGYIRGPYYLGNNEFLITDEYEYQRKEQMKLSIGKYVF